MGLVPPSCNHPESFALNNSHQKEIFTVIDIFDYRDKITINFKYPFESKSQLTLFESPFDLMLSLSSRDELIFMTFLSSKITK